MKGALIVSYNNMINKEYSKNIITELFFICIICLPIINDLITGLFMVPFGISVPLIGFFLFYIFIFQEIRIHWILLLITGILVSEFLISFVRNGINPINVNYFISYLYYGIIPLLFMNSKYNIGTIMKGVSYIGIIAILYYTYIGYDPLDFSENMRRSNILLPCGLAIIYQIFQNKKNSIANKLLFVAALVLYLSLIFSWGTRGSMISVAVYFSLILLANTNTIKRGFIIFTASIILFISILKFENMLLWLASVLNTFGIDVMWIDKTILLLQNDNLSNGRFKIWENALKLVEDRPLIGLGISGFEKIYDMYTHNILLQLLVDFGLILGVIFIFGLMYLLIASLKGKNHRNRKEYILFLIVSCLPVLMFTSVIWYFSTFWLLIYESVKLIKLKQRSIAENDAK